MLRAEAVGGSFDFDADKAAVAAESDDVGCPLS